MSDDSRRRLEALIQVAARLVTTAPSGRILLATIASQLDPVWFAGPDGERVFADFEAARAAASKPLAPGEINTILRAAWDSAPTEVLDQLDPEPIATTPTAQVHRAVLDGKQVAVKVLRPGVAATVRRDLALLETLLAPLGAALPRLDGPALVREARERVLDELDLEYEAGIQRRIQRALRNHPALAVPAPVTRLAHEHVLVSEWIDGTPLREITGGAERDRAAARLTAFVLGGVRAGVMHSGIELDDLLLTADGRLAVIDVGSTCTVAPGGADAALKLLEAFAAGDGDALGGVLEGLGMLPAAHGPAVLAIAGHTLGDLGGTARLDARALGNAAERLSDQSAQALELVLAAHMPPALLWPLRGLAQLLVTLARIGATGSWLALMTGALREGWNAAG